MKPLEGRAEFEEPTAQSTDASVVDSTASQCLDEQEMAIKVDRLLTFEDRPELLRGSSLYNVLRCGGKIFDSSSGDGLTYRLSERVNSLDAFFSHNWSCSRIHKFLCLVCHFNLGPAFFGTMVWTLLLVFLSILEWAPTIEVPDGSSTMGVLGHLTPLPVLWLLLFGCHEILPCSRRRRIFLDKTCIHQEDRDIQRLGIEKLAAFLANADSVVVCYTPVYLRKLWTVYEAAAFLCLKDVRNLYVIPYQLPWLFVATTVVFSIYNACALLLRFKSVPNYKNFEMAFLPVFAFLFASVCRRMARAKADINTTLAEFSVEECACFDANDRPVVYSNIALLMQSRLKLPKHTSEREALTEFEKLVKRLLPRAFAKSLGDRNLPYKYAAIVSTLMLWPRSIDNFLGFLKDGYSFRYFLHTWGLNVWSGTLASGPLALLTIDYCASCRLNLTGKWELAWNCLSAAAGYLAFTICYSPGYFLTEAINDYVPGDPWTEEEDRLYVALFIYSILQMILGPILLSGAYRHAWRFLRRPNHVEDRVSFVLTKASHSEESPACTVSASAQAPPDDNVPPEPIKASPEAHDIIFLESHDGEPVHL